MPIIYEKQAKKVGNPPRVKHYPVVKTQKRITTKEVAKLLADETTLNPMEAEFVLEQLAKILLRIIGNGNSAQLASWISFHATVQASGAETKEECNASLIKRVALRTRFSEDFRHELQKIDFLPLDALRSDLRSRKAGEKDGDEQEGSEKEEK